MDKEEFIGFIKERCGDSVDESEIGALYDAIAGRFVDLSVEYFINNWLPTKGIMFDAHHKNLMKLAMTDDIEKLLQIN